MMIGKLPAVALVVEERPAPAVARCQEPSELRHRPQVPPVGGQAEERQRNQNCLLSSAASGIRITAIRCTFGTTSAF